MTIAIVLTCILIISIIVFFIWKNQNRNKVIGVINIWDKSEPIILNSKPLDDFPESDYVFNEKDLLNPDLESIISETSKLEKIRTEVYSIPSGSLKSILISFKQLERVSREKQNYMLKVYRDSRWENFNAKCSEVRAMVNEYNANKKLIDSENTMKEGGGAAGGAAAGAVIGSFFGGVGAPIGAAVGGLIGWGAGFLSGDESGELLELSDEQVKVEACKLLGWNSNPENEINKEVLSKSIELTTFDLSIANSSITTYEVLLRRAFHSYADSLIMAEVVSSSYQQAKDQYEQVKILYNENSSVFIQAKENFHQAEEHYKRARNTILLTAIITGLAEGFQEFGKMSTQEYRENMKSKGFDLNDLDIDHIIPKAKGGVDHPWNYQAVNSSLNRSWQDGALFQKCLHNPIGFAKAVVINYSGETSGIIGMFYNIFSREKNN